MSQSVDRFEFEQQILGCWTIIEDIRMVSEQRLGGDETLDAIATLYSMKFEQMFNTFEQLVASGHFSSHAE